MLKVAIFFIFLKKLQQGTKEDSYLVNGCFDFWKFERKVYFEGVSVGMLSRHIETGADSVWHLVTISKGAELMPWLPNFETRGRLYYG